MLGLPLLFEIPNAAFVQAGGVRLYLARPETPEHDHPSSILYFRVGDIQAAFDTLRAAGTPIEGEPHLLAKVPDDDLWIGFFATPTGTSAR